MEFACFKHISALRRTEIESIRSVKQVLNYIFFRSNTGVLRCKLCRFKSSPTIFDNARNFGPRWHDNGRLPFGVYQYPPAAKSHGIQNRIVRHNFHRNISGRSAS
jgi:hypothetical protein